MMRQFIINDVDVVPQSTVQVDLSTQNVQHIRILNLSTLTRLKNGNCMLQDNVYATTTSNRTSNRSANPSTYDPRILSKM